MLSEFQTFISKPGQRRQFANSIRYNVLTLWLFTVNDFKTMILPSTLFALFTSNYMGIDISTFIRRMPYVLVWTWMNLLAFTVANQRRPSSVMEDRINKPWRPMPSGRLTPESAYTLGVYAYLLAQVTSILVGGGTAQSILLWMLGYIYNDRGGADRGFIIRNVLNAAGFTSFASGALEVATGGGYVIGNRSIMAWLGVVAAVVATTVHTQDMYDQAGDAVVKRRTVPLVIGDNAARWSIAIALTIWSLTCPLIWKTGMLGYLISGSLGLWVAHRTLCKASVGDDRATFRIYNIWLISLYSLPLLAR